MNAGQQSQEDTIQQCAQILGPQHSGIVQEFAELLGPVLPSGKSRGLATAHWGTN